MSLRAPSTKAAFESAPRVPSDPVCLAETLSVVEYGHFSIIKSDSSSLPFKVFAFSLTAQALKAFSCVIKLVPHCESPLDADAANDNQKQQYELTRGDTRGLHLSQRRVASLGRLRTAPDGFGLEA